VLEDRLLVRAWKRSHRCAQSNAQPEGQVADEAVIPVQDDDQPYNHEEAQRVDSKNSAANAFPERPSTRTTNNASNSLQLQGLGQQSDTDDEAPTRQRTTRTAQPKRAPPAGRKRKKANEIQDTPFYIASTVWSAATGSASLPLLPRYLARASIVSPAATGSASLPLLPRYLARASIVLSIAAVSASLPRMPLGLAPCPRMPLSSKASDAFDRSVSSSESSADVESSLRLLTNTSYVDASGSAPMMGTRRNRSWIRLTTDISLRLSTDEGSLGTTCCLYVSDVSITTDLDCYLHLSKLQVRRGLGELEQRLQEGYERAW
jgi:hypothetical protein